MQSNEAKYHWCKLRAREWSDWPLFVAQPIAPILFIFFSWWKVMIAIVVLNWLWALLRYRYVIVTLAKLGALIVRLKWPISVGICIAFFFQKNYLPAIISLLWPIITLILQFTCWPKKHGLQIIENLFSKKLGLDME